MYFNQPSFALIGPPNTGKTSLFNQLTGSHSRTVNYPGSTVDYLVGESQPKFGIPIKIIDTPGIYTLRPGSLDEEVTINFLERKSSVLVLENIIICLDITQYERHLPLVLQILSYGWPAIVALTMSDLLPKECVPDYLRSELEKRLGVPVVEVDGRARVGVEKLFEKMKTLSNSSFQVELSVPLNREEALFQAKKIIKELAQLKHVNSELQKNRTRLDQWVLHAYLGPIIFFLIMGSFFTAVFWLASPVMELIDQLVGGLGFLIHQNVHPKWVAEILADGVLTSFGAVILFVPQIFILFFGLNLLEDSGYLARAATLVDRPLSIVGLSGKAFVPLLSGFACAVPAIMAARTLRSSRERWVTVFILPLLSCSARIPVYTLLLSFLFFGDSPWKPGVYLALIYIGSMVIGALAAGILNWLLSSSKKVQSSLNKRSQTNHPRRFSAENIFLMELPVYRWPQWKSVFNGSFRRSGIYIKKAGPVIFCLAMFIWLGTHFPRGKENMSETQAMQSSYLGQLGQHMEPVFKPLGVDWRVGVGLLSAFAAREVFVSALAVVFDVTLKDDEAAVRGPLLKAMKEAQFSNGERIFTRASIIGLIVYFMFALQCSSTSAIAGKEMNSWKFAVLQFFVLNILAYVSASAVVHFL
ncbi:MAG: ferrous iron transporter B [Bdellovibrionales bacterium]|nr:ferrous iron transporter B [Bdellovibrionales bacterium]